MAVFLRRRQVKPLQHLESALCHVPGGSPGHVPLREFTVFFGLLKRLFIVGSFHSVIIVAPHEVLRERYRVYLCPTSVQLYGLVAHAVQKVPVMRYYKNSSSVPGQIPFQPVQRLKIQMVRRLVKQKQIRCLQQQFGQREPCFFPSGKDRNAFCPCLLRESHSQQDPSDLIVKVISVYRFISLTDSLILRQQLRFLFHPSFE